MAMTDLIIESNTSNSWTGDQYRFPAPSSYAIDWEDLDLDSYRSVVNGDLNRNVLNRRWAKISLSWRHMSDDDINSLLPRVNTDNLWVRVKSPVFGNEFISFKAYVSKMHVEAIEAVTFNDDLGGYIVSFNIVQEKHASWQQ